MEANVKSPIITFLSFFIKNLYIGLLSDAKFLTTKRIKIRNFFRFLILRSKQIWLLQLIVAGCNEDLF